MKIRSFLGFDSEHVRMIRVFMAVAVIVLLGEGMQFARSQAAHAAYSCPPNTCYAE